MTYARWPTASGAKNIAVLFTLTFYKIKKKNQAGPN